MGQEVAHVGQWGSGHWIEDVLEHRCAFQQSRFQWAPEDAVHIALASARGRCDFSTPGHLRVLAAHQAELREWTRQIQEAMVVPVTPALSAESSPEPLLGMAEPGAAPQVLDSPHATVQAGEHAP